jgi:hypothetical protein
MLIDYLYRGRGEKMLTTVKLARLLYEKMDKRQKIAGLIGYIENSRHGYMDPGLSRVKSKLKRYCMQHRGYGEKY